MEMDAVLAIPIASAAIVMVAPSASDDTVAPCCTRIVNGATWAEAALASVNAAKGIRRNEKRICDTGLFLPRARGHKIDIHGIARVQNLKRILPDGIQHEERLVCELL